MVRIARLVDLGREPGARLDQFLAGGLHGDMAWLEATADRRRHPLALWPEARSAILLGLSYAPASDPLAVLAEKERGAISVYAQGADYHDILKPKLKQVAGALHRAAGVDVKVFVDTAPVMEKPLAALAGLGWQGKHTNLVSRRHGSWLFLGAILTTAEIAAGCRRKRSLRQLPALPRRLSDRRIPGAVPARCPPLHFVPDDRAQGADRSRTAAADRQSHLRMRRLPGGVPVEQVRASRARDEARQTRRDRQSTHRRSARSR